MATESGAPGSGSGWDQPPPPRPAPPPPEGRPAPGPELPFVPLRSRRVTSWEWAFVAVALLVVLGGSFIFLFGDVLTGSDPGTIDSYNEEVLASCELPPESTLVRTFVLRVYDSEGRPHRSLSHVYAVAAETDEVISFYGLLQPGNEGPISAERACRFSQRPLALVAPLPDDGVASPVDAITEPGSTEVVEITEIPPDARTLLRLRLAQRETEGIF